MRGKYEGVLELYFLRAELAQMVIDQVRAGRLVWGALERKALACLEAQERFERLLLERRGIMKKKKKKVEIWFDDELDARIYEAMVEMGWIKRKREANYEAQAMEEPTLAAVHREFLANLKNFRWSGEIEKKFLGKRFLKMFEEGGDEHHE